MSHISRTNAAIYRSQIKKLTAAEMGRRLVVPNDEATCVFFLENQNNLILYYSSRLLWKFQNGCTSQIKLWYFYAVVWKWSDQQYRKLTLPAPIKRKNFCFLSLLPRSADDHWVDPSCRGKTLLTLVLMHSTWAEFKHNNHSLHNYFFKAVHKASNIGITKPHKVQFIAMQSNMQSNM